MKTAVILATGSSMTPEIAGYAMAHADLVVAVSDAYKLAPKAHALVSADEAWWQANPDALEFEGPKFSNASVRSVYKIESNLGTGSNSGLLAMEVAKTLGAQRILLCGYDMRGTHFFGPHPAPLKNTSEHRFEKFKQQFLHWDSRGLEVYNCTANSALTCYPFADLESILK